MLVLTVFLCILIHGNIIFYILKQSSFHKDTLYWVFLLLSHMLYLCICIFVFVLFVFVLFIFVFFVFPHLIHGNTNVDILEKSSFKPADPYPGPEKHHSA